MNNKKGFTLIELLAVIIILGILMIVAIPSVTKYITGSRKSAYIETAKEVVKGAVNLVNSGDLAMKDINATYYMPSTCINVENGGKAKSPYGEFEPAYIVINYNGSGEGYDYYWMSRDDTGQGIKTPISVDDLDEDDIESDITEEQFFENITTIEGRKKFLFYNEDCTSLSETKPSSTGKLLPVNECTYDGLMTVGAEFTQGQYTYRFRQKSTGMNTWTNIDPEGWGVVLTNKDSTSPVTTKICTKINGKPIVAMSYMFFNSKAESIDVSSFDTSNVTDMQYMFLNASNIKKLDLSTFDTSNLTTYYCFVNSTSSLEELIMDNWDLSKTINASTGGSGTINNTPKLKTISAKNWKLPQTFTNVFSRYWGGGNSPVETIDVTGWDLSGTTSLNGVFADSSHLKNIIGLNTWNTSKLVDIGNMFQGCSSLTSLDLSSFNTSNVTNYSSMFNNCTSLTELNLDNWNMSKTYGSGAGGGLITNTPSLKKLSLRNWKIPQAFTHVISRTWGSTNATVEEVDVTGWDLSRTYDIQGLFGDCHNLKKIIGMETWNTSKITSFSNLFYNCYELEELDVSSFNTKNVTDMGVTFYNCYKIPSLDLSNWNTSKVTYMSATFINNYNLKTLNLSNWDVRKVTSLGGFLQGCNELETLIMDNWDMSTWSGSSIGGGMLSGSPKLKTISAKNWKIPASFTHVISRTWAGGGSPIETIDVTGWDLTNARDIQGLFADSRSLTTITGLNTWNTQYVTNMNTMFQNCNRLSNIDLSNFNTNSVTNMQSMFYNCSSLTSLDLSSFKVTQITDSYVGGMFYGCSSLTTGYARTQEDANKLNSANTSKPSSMSFVVK